MTNRFPISLFLLIMTSLVLAIGCSGGDTTTPDPLILNILPGQAGSSTIYGDALVISASGLVPGEFPVLIEAVTPSNAVVSRGRLSADRNGRINNFILAYDVGYWLTAGNGRISPGEYTVRVTASAGTAEADFTVPAAPPGPVGWACDIDGDLANAFPEGDPVFAIGAGFAPNTTYRIWPVEDRRSWSDGDTIISWHADLPAVIWPPEIHAYVEVVTDADGKIEPTQVLPYATKMIPGVTDQFDLVFDAEPYAIFDVDSDAVDGRLPTGVVVQEPLPDGPVYAQLASTSGYTYRNDFGAGDEVYVWLNPGYIMNNASSWVLKYILIHTGEWIDGTPIEDILGEAEFDPVAAGCLNEGLVLVWLFAEPGEYDVLLDMNANGIYDEGIDILDGGPDGPGFTVVAPD